MTDLFDSTLTPEQEVTNPLETLVGEGKKFKTTEDLAKGKLESDRFITRLEQELATVREDLSKALQYKELVDKATHAPASTQTDTTAAERDADEHATTLSRDNVQELVRQTFTTEQEKLTHAQNLDFVRTELTKELGPDYVRALKMKTASLGLGEDFANGLAATKPKVFLKLILGDKASPQDTSVDYAPPKSSFRTTPLSTKSGLKYSDYEKMRRDNPKDYNTPRLQNEMYKAAAEQGESFYS